MLTPNPNALAPMVRKLTKHSQLGAAETQALLDLPYQLAIREQGNYLVREGNKPDSCVLLLSGFVHRSKTAGSGARQILSVHLRGDLVDLQNSLLGEADHSVQALTQVEVAHIPQQAILDVANAYPAVARALWHDTLVDASIFREWILNVGQRNARQRISHLVCEIALRQVGAGLSHGPCYAWPMTQAQIADATGLTPVHVNRIIQAMRKERLIDTSKRSMTIIDWPALQKAGDFRQDYLHQGALAA